MRELEGCTNNKQGDSNKSRDLRERCGIEEEKRCRLELQMNEKKDRYKRNVDVSTNEEVPVASGGVL
jgi:hypothetical protein